MTKFKGSDIEKNWEQDLEKRGVLAPRDNWEEGFKKLAYPIIHSNTFPEKDGQYLDMLIKFIRNLLASRKEENDKEWKERIIEWAKKSDPITRSTESTEDEYLNGYCGAMNDLIYFINNLLK